MTFHFVITVQFGTGLHSMDGTYVTKPGETRKDAYRALVAAATQAGARNSHRGNATTVFFALEPNDLGDGAR